MTNSPVLRFSPPKEAVLHAMEGGGGVIEKLGRGKGKYFPLPLCIVPLNCKLPSSNQLHHWCKSKRHVGRLRRGWYRTHTSCLCQGKLPTSYMPWSFPRSTPLHPPPTLFCYPPILAQFVVLCKEYS